MARSLNKVQLIGNLTRDPELRYTPAGTAVCTFSVATNRQWTTDSGEKKEDAEFHRVVAWNKLAEICSQMLKRGSRVFVEGRLQTREWEGQDGNKRNTTEIIISEMISLEARRDASGVEAESIPDDFGGVNDQSGTVSKPAKSKPEQPAKKDDQPVTEGPAEKKDSGDDIPF